MKGLIIKDFLYMKSQAKIFFVLFLFYLVMFFNNGNSVMLGVLVVMLSSIMTVNCVSIDENSKWDKYACTLPLSRQSTVLARYISLITFATIAIAVSTFVGCIANVFLKQMSIFDTIMLNGVFFLISLLIIAVMLPIFYKFGSNKARIVIMIVIVLPSILAPIISKLIQKSGFSGFNSGFEMSPEFIASAMVIVTAIIMLLSYFITVKIYRKKEF